MSKAERENRAKVKLLLAEKYERLVNISGGRQKKQTLRNRAQKFRNQAAELVREA